MASLIQSLTEEALEISRQVRHVDQGESGSISLLKRNASTGALETLLSVTTGWEYSDRTYDDAPLPGDLAQYELRVAASKLTAAQVKQAVAIKHGSLTFQVARPSPFAPTADTYLWRFWLTPLES